MSDFLQSNWENLTNGLPTIKDEYFLELTNLYTSKNRFYHNLKHIETLLNYSEKYRHLLESPKTIDFAIWYHDSIYDASKNDNEEKSADLAKKHLSLLGFENDLINNCYNLIIATKTHLLPNDLNSFDFQFLLDIDLSILASERNDYIEYTTQIRKEYNMYPNFLYKKGRKKVLKHFLEMKQIYKTELFQNLWEEKAKENISYELSLL